MPIDGRPAAEGPGNMAKPVKLQTLTLNRGCTELGEIPKAEHRMKTTHFATGRGLDL
jgi:hypothetical protein